MGLSPINSGILHSKGGAIPTTDDRGAGATGGGRSVFFRTMDCAVVKFGKKVPFPTPIHGSADLSRGTNFLLFDNYWNTNYVFWWPYVTKPGWNSDNLIFRFAIELYSKRRLSLKTTDWQMLDR